MRIRNLFLAASLFVFLPFANAKVHLPDPLESLESQIQYLLFLQQEIPALFEQGAEYDVDFFALIQNQNKLVQFLSAHDEFLAQSNSRPPLAEIRVDLAEVQNKAATYRFNKNALERALKSSTGDKPLTQLNPRHNAAGLLTALLSLHSAELKSQGFKLRTFEQKLNFLRENPVAKSTIDSKFKAEKFNLEPSNWEQLLETARAWIEKDLSVARQLLSQCLQVHSDDECGELFGSNEELWENVKTGSNFNPQTLENVRQNLRQQFAEKEINGQVSMTTALRLQEVPAYVGIFRGLVGGDCSTNMCFPYVYMPQERTYFLYSAHGILLGYLMGTMVRSENKTAFYIHSISGPDISRRDLQLALHGLSKAAGDLGFHEILLPTREVIHRNINYVAIHKVLYELLEAELHDIEYLDNNIRLDISKPAVSVSNNASYDLANANPYAHRVQLDQELLAKLGVSVNKLAPPKIVANKPLSKSDSILVALDLLAGGSSKVAKGRLLEVVDDIRRNLNSAGSISYDLRIEAADKILQPLGIKFEHFDLPQKLANPIASSLSSYYESLKKDFARYDVDLNDQLIESRPYLFYEGHLAARDAATTQDPVLAKRTVHFVINMIKRWPNPKVAYNAVRANPRLFEKSVRFRNMVNLLSHGDEADQAKLALIIDSGVHLPSNESLCERQLQ